MGFTKPFLCFDPLQIAYLSSCLRARRREMLTFRDIWRGVWGFTIQSGNVILFYISAFLLAYISPVFKDKINLESRKLQEVDPTTSGDQNLSYSKLSI